MKVHELMSTDVKSCTEDTDLATASRIMWDGDCGFVPVVNADRRPIGVITDRDICIAAATRSTAPAAIRAGDVMAREISTCNGHDDVQAALAILKTRRVRRLPVVDAQHRLIGVLSLNDLVVESDLRRGAGVPAEEVLDTLKAISAHPGRLVSA